MAWKINHLVRRLFNWNLHFGYFPASHVFIAGGSRRVAWFQNIKPNRQTLVESITNQHLSNCDQSFSSHVWWSNKMTYQENQHQYHQSNFFLVSLLTSVLINSSNKNTCDWPVWWSLDGKIHQTPSTSIKIPRKPWKGWWLGHPVLKNDGLRQLGWQQPNISGKIKLMATKPPPSPWCLKHVKKRFSILAPAALPAALRRVRPSGHSDLGGEWWLIYDYLCGSMMIYVEFCWTSSRWLSWLVNLWRFIN